MSELKPCPRCKEALRLSVQNQHEFYGPDESLYFFVLCSACGRSSYSGYTREEAIKDWNTRPIEDAQVAEIEQLKVRVTELSNALLVEKANNARMREALEAWQKFEKYSDKENAYELLKTAEILTKQALKGEG